MTSLEDILYGIQQALDTVQGASSDTSKMKDTDRFKDCFEAVLEALDYLLPRIKRIGDMVSVHIDVMDKRLTNGTTSKEGSP